MLLFMHIWWRHLLFQLLTFLKSGLLLRTCIYSCHFWQCRKSIQKATTKHYLQCSMAKMHMFFHLLEYRLVSSSFHLFFIHCLHLHPHPLFAPSIHLHSLTKSCVPFCLSAMPLLKPPSHSLVSYLNNAQKLPEYMRTRKIFNLSYFTRWKSRKCWNVIENEWIFHERGEIKFRLLRF